MGSPVFSKVYIDTSNLLSGDTLVNNVHKLTNPPFCTVRSLKQNSISKPPCPSWCLTSYTSCNSGVSLFPFTCRCAFMCEHVCVCVCVCACVCVCVHVEMRVTHFINLQFLYWGRVSLWTPSSPILPLQQACFLCLSPAHWGYRQTDHHTCLASSRSWNCRLQSSDLLYPLSHLSIPPQ